MPSQRSAGVRSAGGEHDDVGQTRDAAVLHSAVGESAAGPRAAVREFAAASSRPFDAGKGSRVSRHEEDDAAAIGDVSDEIQSLGVGVVYGKGLLGGKNTFERLVCARW